MNNVSVKVRDVNSTYQKIAYSTPVQFVKEQPIVAGVGATGAVTLAASAIDKSVLLKIGQKGIIPAVAAGVVITGGSIINDAIKSKPVEDDKSTPNIDEHARGKLKKNFKIAGGTAMVLGGTETIGYAYNVSALKPITTSFQSGIGQKAIGAGLILTGGKIIYDVLKDDRPASFLSSDDRAVNDQALVNVLKSAAGIGISSAGLSILGKEIIENASGDKPISLITTTSVVVAAAAAKNMKDKGVGVGNSLALTAGLSGVTAVATDIVGKSNNFMYSGKGLSLVAGAGLGLATYGFAKNAKESFSENKLKSGLNALGAVGSGMASVHLLGTATGIEALSSIVPKTLITIAKNPVLTTAVVATGIGVGGYIVYSNNKNNEEKEQVKK
jgi:hypothetical protein